MTIVTVGKQILQEPRKEAAEYVVELCQNLKGMVRAVIEQSLNEILRKEVDEWLERKHYRRRKRGKRQKVKECCSRCQSHQRQNFRRNGYYERGLNAQWGRLKLAVPQVKCACGGNVRLRHQLFRPGQRMWDDFAVEVRIDYGRGLSYRKIKEDWDDILGGSVGLRTINRRILEAKLAEKPDRIWRSGEAPPVVRVDAIWITVMYPTGETKEDRLGRKRPVKKAHKVAILAAQGVWPLTGQTRLLAWMKAEGEDTASWEKFLEHLYHLGITPENGLALLVSDGGTGFRAAYENRYWMVPLQRCVFHKLRNIAKAIRTPTDLDRQAALEYRTLFLRQAARIWQAEDVHQARLTYQAFCQQWREQQPKAIATLERDFDQTLTFYAVQEHAASLNQVWPARLLRTTSPLERMFREFRQRYRNAFLFHSEAGAIAATAQIASRFS